MIMSNDHKKRHLHLAVDNDPGYKLKPIEQRVLERTQRKHEEQIENIENINKRQVEGMKKSFRKKGLAAALMIAAATGIYISQYNPGNAPQEFIPLQKDLNHDNVPDAYILQQDGHKVPMYGVRENGDTILYKNAEYMKRQNDIIDYKSIEDQLNSK